MLQSRKRTIMRLKKLISIFTIALAITVTGCQSKQPSTENQGNVSGEENKTPTPGDATQGGEEQGQEEQNQETEVQYPITVKHAFGETIIESKPEKVAAIGWGNPDVALALGVTPVGLSKSTYGVLDGSGLLSWTKEAFENLGVDSPVLFNDTDGLDFEAISDVQPDVILAAYSGITEEEYNLLSAIAPVVAYPDIPWRTYWREQILLNAAGMGMEKEGQQLVSDLETLIADKVAAYPQLAGKKVAFTYIMPSNLSMFYLYVPTDSRMEYLVDLGMEIPESVTTLGKDATGFFIEVSAEQVDVLNDVDIMITYGTSDLLGILQADSLLGTIPAIANGSVVVIEDGTPLAAACTPSVLSIPATIDEYLSLIGEVVNK